MDVLCGTCVGVDYNGLGGGTVAAFSIVGGQLPPSPQNASSFTVAKNKHKDVTHVENSYLCCKNFYLWL